MTGFGRCEVSEGDRKFTVEMKGVNHRYLCLLYTSKSLKILGNY